MGQELLVERHFTDGQRLLHQLQDDGFSYAAAAWVKDDRTERWFLYVVTDLVDSVGKIAAYSKLNDSRKKLPDLFMESFDFKLFSPTSPFGLCLRTYVAKLDPAPLITHYRLPDLGSDFINEAYIYPRDLQPAFKEWSTTEGVESRGSLALANTVPVYPTSS